MIRPLLHLLLALTLALNGVSAPAAMARANHLSHASHCTPSQDGYAPVQMKASARSQPDHLAEAAAEADPDATPLPTDESCCEGTTCPCGSGQPPDVLGVAFELMPPPIVEARFLFSAQHAAVRRDSPPLRPPAV